MRRLLRVAWLGAAMLGAGLTGCADRAGGDPEQLLDEGWRRFRLGDYRAALRAFDLVAANPAAEPSERRGALFGLATTWNLRQPVPSQDEERAANFYQQIIDEVPDDDLAAWSALALARMTHLVPVGETPDYDAVRAAYQAVIDRYPDRLAGHEALIYQQSTWIMTLDEEPTRRAIARLRQFLETYPQSAFASAAYGLLAHGYETLHEYELLLEARLRELHTLEIDPDNPAAADYSWRYWGVATAAEFMAGRLDVARIYYQKLIDEYPMDFRVFPAKQALERIATLEHSLREAARP